MHTPSTIKTSAFLKSLLYASFLYLALPLFLFFAGHLQLWAAFFFSGCLLLALGQVFKSIRRMPAQQIPALEIQRRHVLLLALVVLLWASLSGMGGYGFQERDWSKHNTILHTLIEYAWPVRFDHNGTSFTLVYYTAFLLPAAAVGKILGWQAANFTLFLWGYAGLLLSLLWFSTLVKRFGLLPFLFFTVFGGLDVLGKIIMTGAIPSPYGLEVWIGGAPPPWHFLSMTAFAFWVPNHALVGWIGMGILLFFLEHSFREHRYFIFMLALTPLWSPFITVGMAPFFFIPLLLGKKSSLYKSYLNLPNAVGLTFLLLFAAYYLSKLTMDVDHPYAVPPYGFIFQYLPVDSFIDTVMSVARLLFFLMIEMGIYALLIFASMKKKEALHRSLLLISVLTLVAVTTFKFGFFNDLAARASIPALYVLALLVYRALSTHRRQNKPAFYGLLIALLIGAVSPTVDIARHVYALLSEKITTTREVKTLSELDQEETDMEGAFFYQYVGDADGFFFRTLARRPARKAEATDPSP